MKTPLDGKRIVLGVTGSIAAYKAVDLASKLAQSGAQVETILTQAATRFVSFLSFQSVTGWRAYTDEDLWGGEGHVQHIGLAKNADLLVIAPATANTIAKLASGLADNLLSLTALAATCPLILAPAMDGGMFEHPATNANLALLRQRGATVIGPAIGHLASGMNAVGRMVEPVELVGRARYKLAQGGPLAGYKVVVTAGGTQEPVDPVRVITNRSSGKQGFALAQAALDLGAEVILIAGATSLSSPCGVERVDVSTAQEMLEAVLRSVADCDILIMAAAVADFRPASPAGDKIKKAGAPPQIQLEKTEDILLHVAQQKNKNSRPLVTVGFAAESRDLLDNARAKLDAKRLDLIVANDISAADAGFAIDTNRVTILSSDGSIDSLPLLSKDQVAQEVLARVVKRMSVE